VNEIDLAWPSLTAVGRCLVSGSAAASAEKLGGWDESATSPIPLPIENS